MPFFIKNGDAEILDFLHGLMTGLSNSPGQLPTWQVRTISCRNILRKLFNTETWTGNRGGVKEGASRKSHPAQNILQTFEMVFIVFQRPANHFISFFPAINMSNLDLTLAFFTRHIFIGEEIVFQTVDDNVR